MAGYGVGGAAAGGIRSGFEMGLQADEFAQRKKLADTAQARQNTLDTQRQMEIDRQHKREDEQDRVTQYKNELAVHTQAMEDNRFETYGLSVEHGGIDKIPLEKAQPVIDRAKKIRADIDAMNERFLKPVVDARMQKGKDVAARLEAHQIEAKDLSDDDFQAMIFATGLNPADLLRDDQTGKSKIGQAADDFTAGVQSGNQGLMVKGASTLLDHEINKNLGGIADDGSTIIKKELYGLLPAMPQQGGQGGQGLQPPPQNPIQGLAGALTAAMSPQGQGMRKPDQPPSSIMPVLQVTARHPDGTEVSYPAPLTKNRSTDPNDPPHPGIDMKQGFDHVGRMTTLEHFANLPGVKERIQDMVYGPMAPGQVAHGNIDLHNRPAVKNSDGSISTVRSMSIEIDGKEVLIPTVSDDGKVMSNDEAIAQYKETGKNLGTFSSAAAATKYAQSLHQQQAKEYGTGAHGTAREAYALMHGDPVALANIGQTDPTSLKIKALVRLRDELGLPKTAEGLRQAAEIEAGKPSGDEKESPIRKKLMESEIRAHDAAAARSNRMGLNVTHGSPALTDAEDDALYGPEGAVTEKRLDPNRINSRTEKIFAKAAVKNPDLDFARISADINLERNPGFQQKARLLEVLPEIMNNMVVSGKKVGFSDVKTIGKMQAWVKGELNDPDMTEYMGQRNDALMSIAGAMRGVGMTDMAHKAETEVAAPTMSPAALDAWMRGQMKSLEPRLKQNRGISDAGGDAVRRRHGESSPNSPGGNAPKVMHFDAQGNPVQ